MEHLGDRMSSAVEAVLSANPQDAAAIGKLVLSSSDIAALGRFVVTKDPKDIGKFKTPSLRNVAIGGPYMHDGSVDTLAEAVDLETYQRTDASGRPIILTPVERMDLLDFLTTLTGREATLPLRDAALSQPATAKTRATTSQALATSAR
ncbi:hypothetical protein AXG89_33350 (plasmid) [Burkholderia sp. PAMC 26561]|nr:hypothetical protein AXG89_33350 [Burkholderia sp. PAMC 26561]